MSKLHVSVPPVTISSSGHYVLQGRAGNNREESEYLNCRKKESFSKDFWHLCLPSGKKSS